MNIMLASVTQRIREIGIRRAVGATRGRFSGQFLIEAVVMSGVGGVIGILAASVRICDCAVRGMEDGVFVAGHRDRVTVSAAVRGFLPDCIPRVAPRRSIRSRHCGMNEPIGSVQPVVLLKSLSKSYRLGGRRFPCWIGSMRGSMRVNAWR